MRAENVVEEKQELSSFDKIYQAAKEKSVPKITAALTEVSVDVYDGVLDATPIQKLAAENDTDSVNFLLSFGASEFKRAKGYAQGRHTDKVKELLEATKNPDLYGVLLMEIACGYVQGNHMDLLQSEITDPRKFEKFFPSPQGLIRATYGAVAAAIQLVIGNKLHEDAYPNPTRARQGQCKELKEEIAANIFSISEVELINTLLGFAKGGHEKVFYDFLNFLDEKNIRLQAAMRISRNIVQLCAAEDGNLENGRKGVGAYFMQSGYEAATHRFLAWVKQHHGDSITHALLYTTQGFVEMSHVPAAIRFLEKVKTTYLSEPDLAETQKTIFKNTVYAIDLAANTRHNPNMLYAFIEKLISIFPQDYQTTFEAMIDIRLKLNELGEKLSLKILLHTADETWRLKMLTQLTHEEAPNQNTAGTRNFIAKYLYFADLKLKHSFNHTQLFGWLELEEQPLYICEGYTALLPVLPKQVIAQDILTFLLPTSISRFEISILLDTQQPYEENKKWCRWLKNEERIIVADNEQFKTLPYENLSCLLGKRKSMDVSTVKETEKSTATSTSTSTSNSSSGLEDPIAIQSMDLSYSQLFLWNNRELRQLLLHSSALLYTKTLTWVALMEKVSALITAEKLSDDTVRDLLNKVVVYHYQRKITETNGNRFSIFMSNLTTQKVEQAAASEEAAASFQEKRIKKS